MSGFQQICETSVLYFIDERVENMQQASLSQEDFEQDFDCHSQESQSTSDFDSIQVQENTEHMMADFEAMYNEEAALTKEEEEEEEEEGEEEREVGRDGDNIYRTGVIDQRGVSSEEDSVDDDEDTSCEEGNTHITHSLSDTLCCKFPSVSGDDQSCDQSHDTTEDNDQSTDRMREREVEVRRQGSSDIEEGELSESSDSKGNSQEVQYECMYALQTNTVPSHIMLLFFMSLGTTVIVKNQQKFGVIPSKHVRT